MEGHSVDRAAVSLLLHQALPGLDIPEAPRLIIAGSCEVLPHGVEGQPPQPQGVALHRRRGGGGGPQPTLSTVSMLSRVFRGQSCNFWGQQGGPCNVVAPSWQLHWLQPEQGQGVPGMLGSVSLPGGCRLQGQAVHPHRQCAQQVALSREQLGCAV